MNIVEGLVIIGAGIGVMAFGLLLFYAILPLYYGLLGVGVGYWLGVALGGLMPATAGWLSLVLAIAGGVGFGLLAYFFEPIRRVLVGIGTGAAVGFAIAGALGVNELLMLLGAFIGAIIGIPLALAIFDQLIIIASSLAGAAAALDGAHLILPGVDRLDRTIILSEGNWITLMLWLVLTAVGIVYQASNLEGWRERFEARGSTR